MDWFSEDEIIAWVDIFESTYHSWIRNGITISYYNIIKTEKINLLSWNVQGSVEKMEDTRQIVYFF